MPALKLFGRRWNIASDDLPLVAIWPTAFHGAWAIILFASWLALERPKACHPGRKYTVALAGLGAACAVNFGLGVWIVCESLRGTLHEPVRLVHDAEVESAGGVVSWFALWYGMIC